MLAYLKFKFGGDAKKNNKVTAAPMLAKQKGPNVVTTTTSESESYSYYSESQSSAAVSSDSPNSLYKRQQELASLRPINKRQQSIEEEKK